MRLRSVGGMRGNPLLRAADRYLGVPIVAAAGTIKRSRPWPERARRIGVLNATSIGDTVMLSPVVQDIASAFPEATTTLFTSATNLPLLRGLQNVRTTAISIANPRAAVPAIRRERLDVILDFDSWPRIEPIYCMLSGASFAAGFRAPGQHRHFWYDVVADHSPSSHELDNFRRLARAIGVESQSLPKVEPAGKLPDELRPPRPYVVFHLWPTGISSELKEWPRARWRRLAAGLVERGHTIVLTGSPADAPATQAFVQSAPELEGELFDGAGRYDLGQIVDLVCGSRCVVSVNTGVMHIAAAAGVPTVALNGPTSERRWGPVGERAVSVNSELPGCGYLYFGWEYEGERKDCMEGITVERVLDAVLELMREPLTA
jgi:heptosyltransferase III